MIPLATPKVASDGINRVVNLLESGILSTGEIVSEFETQFGEYVGRECGIAVASGSVALELALEAIFEAGDSIAISPYNCGTILYSVQRADLQPVFVDADPNTASVDPARLQDHAVDLEGVLLSHLFGRPADVEAIRDIAASHKLTIVEDFSQAPGAMIDGEMIGAVGQASVCSFGATKNVTTAEGGIVLTDDSVVAEYIEAQRSNTHDISPPPRSVRMNDIEAAIGCSQLQTYHETLDRKRSIAAIYREQLSNVEVDLLPDPMEAKHAYQSFPIRHEDADELASFLNKNDIGTSRLYDTPLHEYKTAPPTERAFPVARQFADKVVLIPIHPQLSDNQAHTIASTVGQFCVNQ